MKNDGMIGIIGGTGLYQMEGLEIRETRTVQTPFGAPSAPVVLGTLDGHEVAFLPRHGVAHELLPSEINYRANLYALKSLGVRRIVGVSATGSLEKAIAPGDLAIPEQYLDWTRGKRAGTFFGEGLAAHVSTAEPTCPQLARGIEASAREIGSQIHVGKTYACVEGPRLGTRAESHFLRASGCQLVGMTNVPEVFLAREAQLCYCTIAIATDYDCWLDDPSQHASVDKVMKLYGKNLARVQKMLRALVSRMAAASPECGCGKSLQYAVLSREETLPPHARELLAFLRK